MYYTMYDPTSFSVFESAMSINMPRSYHKWLRACDGFRDGNGTLVVGSSA